jgi:S-adenosylmethionine:tRNA ribosyltransferase-isomerase
MGDRIVKRTALLFERPEGLEATLPIEARGGRRDEGRLLVSTPHGHTHARFRDLPDFLDAGDLIVVNDSATVPASVPAKGEPGAFTLNVSTQFGHRLWLAEPRWSADRPGPLPLDAGDHFKTCAGDVLVVAPYPGTDRLWFVEGDLESAMAHCGEPIHYAYVAHPQPLMAYQSIFSRVPGSAEMPNAARPFTTEVVDALRRKGVELATIRLHTGVSSLDVTEEDVEDHPVPPEPFRVSAETADAVNRTRESGHRVVAIGTTVVRALESAYDNGVVRPAEGFTRVLVTPSRGVHTVDGLLTGFHDPGASHLAMLYAVAGQELVRAGYEEAVGGRYLWHEFGDSHLLLPDR